MEATVPSSLRIFLAEAATINEDQAMGWLLK